MYGYIILAMILCWPVYVTIRLEQAMHRLKSIEDTVTSIDADVDDLWEVCFPPDPDPPVDENVQLPNNIVAIGKKKAA